MSRFIKCWYRRQREIAGGINLGNNKNHRWFYYLGSLSVLGGVNRGGNDRYCGFGGNFTTRHEVLKRTVQRPCSAFSATNVRAAKATAPGRPPASTRRAGSEEDLAAGSGDQGAASPRGDGRARRTFNGGKDARGFVEASWVPAAFRNIIDENKLTDSPLRSSLLRRTSVLWSPEFLSRVLATSATRDSRTCGLPEEANDSSVEYSTFVLVIFIFFSLPFILTSKF